MDDSKCSCFIPILVYKVPVPTYVCKVYKVILRCHCTVFKITAIILCKSFQVLRKSVIIQKTQRAMNMT